MKKEDRKIKYCRKCDIAYPYSICPCCDLERVEEMLKKTIKKLTKRVKNN